MYFYGGPFHKRTIEVAIEFLHHHRLELRVTSTGNPPTPIPRAYQPVAIYVRRPGRSLIQRYFLGMADEGEGE